MQNFQETGSASQFKVVTFYCFISLDEEVILSLISQLKNIAMEGQVLGTVLLANEGVNGTICGPMQGVCSLIENLQEAISNKKLEVKISWTSTQIFRRFKARKKCEIVTMGVAGINPAKSAGVYVDPLDWNAYLSDPGTLVIDTRNEYEVAIGSFEGALNPHTDNFREFPSWVDKHLHALVKKRRSKRIAMFCTGGIRCEKATSYLLKEGFTGVHHLQGGILKYLEKISDQDSLWNGECFVFDKRVALDHKLLPGTHSLCYACGMPLSPKECQDSTYIRGVQCLHCEDFYSERDKVRFAERQLQIDKRLRQGEKNLFTSQS